MVACHCYRSSVLTPRYEPMPLSLDTKTYSDVWLELWRLKADSSLYSFSITLSSSFSNFQLKFFIEVACCCIANVLYETRHKQTFFCLRKSVDRKFFYGCCKNVKLVVILIKNKTFLFWELVSLIWQTSIEIPAEVFMLWWKWSFGACVWPKTNSLLS